MTRVRAVLFDMIGTTVLENDPRVIGNCFQGAFSKHAIPVGNKEIRAIRGMDKKEAISLILKNRKDDQDLGPNIFESFKTCVQENVSNFSEHPELGSVITQLKQRKIKIGIASGLPRVLFQMLFDRFHWQQYAFDYVNVYENFPSGRPDPAMIFDMCQTLQVHVREVLKVGDTVADIEEGRKAGALTAAVLAGTQPDSVLREANPDLILNSLGKVIDFLK